MGTVEPYGNRTRTYGALWEPYESVPEPSGPYANRTASLRAPYTNRMGTLRRPYRSLYLEARLLGLAIQR